MPSSIGLPALVDGLAKHYGPPPPPITTDPFEQVLLESVAYLADDERRRAAFEALRRRVGTRPEQVLAAPAGVLRELVAGILPDQRVARLRAVAEIALREFGGSLDAAVRRPLDQARRALQRFPGIGVPGADKILLLAGTHTVLPVDSNGLRVLLRLGFGVEKKSYDATYRSVQEALSAERRRERSWLLRAHQVLRRHGQELCRRTRPACSACPVRPGCPHGRRLVTTGQTSGRAKGRVS